VDTSQERGLFDVIRQRFQCLLGDFFEIDFQLKTILFVGKSFITMTCPMLEVAVPSRRCFIFFLIVTSLAACGISYTVARHLFHTTRYGSRSPSSVWSYGRVTMIYTFFPENNLVSLCLGYLEGKEQHDF
jgi:hypothetical protein